MAVTTYFSLAGQLIGEHTTGGPQIDYIPDALGSVVAAVDENLNTVYAASYTPFGQTIASTGTAPRLTWCGTLGYLSPAGQTHCEHHVSTRFYSDTAGSWTSVDKLWPRQPAYGYARGNPTSSATPSGRGRTRKSKASLLNGRRTGGNFASVSSSAGALPHVPTGGGRNLCPILEWEPALPKWPQQYLYPLPSTCSSWGYKGGCGEGETVCNFGTGNPASIVCDNGPCSCLCTVVHEQTHQRQIKDCCGAASAAWNRSAGTFLAHSPIYEKFLGWFNENKTAFECEAYGNDADCILFLLAQLEQGGCSGPGCLACFDALNLNLDCANSAMKALGCPPNQRVTPCPNFP